MKKIILLAIIIATATLNGFAQNKMTIQVNGIKEIKGTIMVAVFSDATNFMKKPYKAQDVKITDTTQLITFDLPNGEYAVTLFKDSNNNKDIDLRSEYGIPMEKYGFSNNVVPTSGPPTFEQLKVKIDKDTIIKIDLK